MNTLILLVLLAGAGAGIVLYMNRRFDEADSVVDEDTSPTGFAAPHTDDDADEPLAGETPEQQVRRIHRVASLASTIAQASESFELDQMRLSPLFYQYSRDDITAAIDSINWAEVVAYWQNGTLSLVEEQGTNIQTVKRHAEVIYRAVRAERALRSTGMPPKGHGMGLDGRQR